MRKVVTIRVTKDMFVEIKDMHLAPLPVPSDLTSCIHP